MTPGGPDVVAFAEATATHRPRFYLTNSGVHNPTGAALTAATAHRLLKIADAHDMVIIEDDIFADFEHAPSARLAAFDGLDRTIRIGSFSKSLSAAVRCGHIAARPDWIEALADLRIATSMAGSPLAASLLHTVLTDGSYRRHVEGIRARLARATARVARRLRDVGVEPWIEPAAGIFLWARLPDGVDAVDLAGRAIGDGIVLAPGPVFSTSGGWRDHMRFNVAMSDDDRLVEQIGGARKSLRDEESGRIVREEEIQAQQRNLAGPPNYGGPRGVLCGPRDASTIRGMSSSWSIGEEPAVFAHHVRALLARQRREDEEAIAGSLKRTGFRAQGDDREGRGSHVGPLTSGRERTVDFHAASPLTRRDRQTGRFRVPHFDVKAVVAIHPPSRNGV
ncbi:hypothetical protein LTR94_026899, partial [Friedmanniomyces endolithicus]